MPKTKVKATPFCFIAICPHYWGRGKTLPEAKSLLRKSGGSMDKEWGVFLIVGDAGAFVDDMGRVMVASGGEVHRVDGDKEFLLDISI